MVMASVTTGNSKKIFDTFRNGQMDKVPFLAKECIHTLKLIHSIYASEEKGRKIYLSEQSK